MHGYAGCAIAWIHRIMQGSADAVRLPIKGTGWPFPGKGDPGKGRGHQKASVAPRNSVRPSGS
jgi:hypothetical protein